MHILLDKGCGVVGCVGSTFLKGGIGMTWKMKTAIGILLLVARIVSDEEWRDEIKTLATHISVHAREV
jgi:hypothetical protein